MASIVPRSSGNQTIREFALRHAGSQPIVLSHELSNRSLISASSSELRPLVRESGVRRQPSVVTNKSVGKLRAFFESTANRFKNWKKSLPERALNKSVAKANREILRGLSNRGNFKELHQGLKRLVNAAQKHSGKTGVSNEAATVSIKLKEIAYDAVKIKNIEYQEKNIQEYTDPTNNYISKHSDRNTLFHRMLTGLARIGIVSENYKSSRESHIHNLDSKILMV
ncbi:hypothetical protein [Labrenzia sp. OB1]|uniref:hypothetical protein n=1 Tax=Labrenzia sp. OB1 TaxID=1561204 RepID=UPI000A5E2311|nr:hypothetical protein [Labrenzia sp. OB1]